ncbi:hypothetical protein H5410_052819 [Solanum commersonii]|uniref:Uncharacterized protein n=1 Tax=Solanum commersonii TaxID=4109 RepID=A0A9J5X595_SOLCO|nr:hypothetical protein H5410_052819 [Solanum commersonii]
MSKKQIETPRKSPRFDEISTDNAGAISESEVTGTVASKFGGPRIAKEHVSDITNYPTPIPPTRKLK